MPEKEPIKNPLEIIMDDRKEEILKSIKNNERFIVSIDVDFNNISKYVVFKGENDRIYIIAKPLAYHDDISQWLYSFSPEKSLESLGGGYILKNDEEKNIKIFGRSSRGEDTKEQTCEILKSAFPDFSVSIDKEG